MQTVIVTGGAGFLGGAVARTAPPEWECHVTERSTAAAAGIRHRCDLSSAEEVRRLFGQVKPRLVVHTAYGIEHMERDIWEATRNVVDACVSSGAEPSSWTRSAARSCSRS